jgi:hypothetical protein
VAILEQIVDNRQEPVVKPVWPLKGCSRLTATQFEQWLNGFANYIIDKSELDEYHNDTLICASVRIGKLALSYTFYIDNPKDDDSCFECSGVVDLAQSERDYDWLGMLIDDLKSVGEAY